ncbi:MAG: DUF5077 domain-containing protein [Sedimentisphaerales bacterium]|nr:DUF5077 domain-containing protein [Sedimentisphaerales bacterium]
MKQLFFMMILLVAGSVFADTLHLKASIAVINGDNIAYESWAGRDCIGSWENENATVSWNVELKKAGEFTISVEQAADRSGAGNQYSVTIAGKSAIGTVKDTGDWGVFTKVEIGRLEIGQAGKYQVIVRALSKKDKAVMNLKSVILEGEALEGAVLLVPVEKRRGVYFSKKQYIPRDLPTFALSREFLPEPILEANPGYSELYWKCWELAFTHMKKPEASNGFVSNYLDEAFNPNIFQWDTIFMVMFARYANHIFPAIESLDNFYCKQHNNGFICREIWETTGDDHHSEQSPEAINPPLFSWAEMENFRVTGNKARLAIVLPVLVKYVEWLETGRKRPDAVHGLYWSNSLGSGMDNTPRTGSGWVDMSAQMVIQYNDLAAMCEQLGKVNDANKFRSRAKDIAAKINKWMWNEEDGLYYDIDDQGQQIKWKTVGCFWPLLAGITSKEQEARLIANLKDPDTFWRKNVFPALAADQKYYEPTGGYWRGGVWPPTTYAIIRGLTSLGYEDFAIEATKRHLDSMYEVYKQTNTVWELYAPDMDRLGSGNAGEKGEHQARPDFVGWTGCGPIALLIENVIGMRPDGVNNKLSWNLNRTDRHGINKLRFGMVTASLICEKRNDNSAAPSISVTTDHEFVLTIIWSGGTKSFELKQGTHKLQL